MSLVRRLGSWAGRIGLAWKMAIALAAAALGSGIATYLALTGAPPFGPRPDVVLFLLTLDLVLLLALAALVLKRLVRVWAERRQGLAGSRLQVRLVGLFSLIAVLPTIIVAVFSYLFFSFGVESWFSDKVRDRKSTRLNSSHMSISYAVFCLKKKKNRTNYQSVNHYPSLLTILHVQRPTNCTPHPVAVRSLLILEHAIHILLSPSLLYHRLTL